MDNSVNIIPKILKCVPVLENAGKAIETLSDIRKDYLKYKDEIQENDSTLLKTFYEELKQKKGSIHEFDAVSEFIYDNLINCNVGIEEEKRKENVLIIDDLDRIDPEHIFRLLNVFSAHFDRDNNANKFGFDKIIFVCDIKNIRNIFATKYGQNTDFNGYIDKFYSSAVFPFNNKVAVLQFVKEIMHINYIKGQNSEINISAEEIDHIRKILCSFVENKVINLRHIFANVKNLKDKKQGVGVIGRFRNYYPGYTVIWICFKILGGEKDTLINAFKTISLSSIEFISPNYLATIMLPLLTEDADKNTDYTNPPISTFNKDNVKIGFHLKEMSRYNSRIYAELVSPTSISYDDLQTILVEAVNALDEKGLLI